MRFIESIQAKSNLILTVRERGKIVERREGHNIWVDLGREYLAELITYSDLGVPTPERDDRIRYIGVGIGGTRQLVSPVPAPVGTDYPGTNDQTDTDPTVTTLERPVRVTSAPLWLSQISSAVHPIATQTKFSVIFVPGDISYGSYLSVPLSEIGLFTNAADPAQPDNTLVAYDTYDTISKTAAFTLEVDWTVRF
jgi:hypothetical protein